MKKILILTAVLFGLSGYGQQIVPNTKSGDTSLHNGWTRFPHLTSSSDTTNNKPMGLASNGLSYRMSFWPGGSGTVTSVATGYGLAGGPVTTTGTVRADSATLFQNVLSTIALTTTGTSGAATWNSGTRILNIPQYSGGVTTMGAFGSTPNGNGASISGSTLTLQPADGTNPGGVSTTTQTLPGAKTFSSALTSSVSTTTPILIGGTGVGSTLQIRPTSGVGSTGADIIIQMGNNGGTEIARILGSNNYTGFGTASPLMKFDITNGTQVTGSNSGNPTVLNVTGVNNSLTGGAATMYVNSSSALAADNGGSIGFGALITTASNSSLQNMAVIKGGKVNSTSNNYDGYFVVGVQSHSAGAMVERMKLTATGLGIRNTAPANVLSLGTAGTASGTWDASGSTSGTITFALQAAAGTYNWNWPTTAGSSGQALLSGGGGASAMTWSAVATGANNGLSLSSGNVQWGGSALTQNSTISTSAFFMDMFGSHSNNTFRANNSSTGNALEGQNTSTGVGVMGVSTSGTAVAAFATGTQPTFLVTARNSGTNTVQELVKLQRFSTGTPTNGIGASLGFYLESSTTEDQSSNVIRSTFHNATHASRSSTLTFTGVGNAGDITLLSMKAVSSTAAQNTFTGQVGSSAFTLTDGVTIALDWDNGNVQKVTLGGNRTFTFANPIAGMRYLIQVTQDATGSRTLTWPTIKWAGGTAPTLTTTANKTDLIFIYYDGTSYFGEYSLNF